MIDVRIIENNGLVAVCTIRGSSEEFRADLARLKSIPFEDRDYSDETRHWTIRNAENYAEHITEIGDAIRYHKSQIRMF